MRRVLTLALALLVLGVAVPGAWAQPAAPIPQVTITGFVDTITSWSSNLQDNLPYRTGDKEWYARNRGRFDIIGQLGTAKAVFGFEIDSVWGTTSIGGQDNNRAAGGVGAQHSERPARSTSTPTPGLSRDQVALHEFPGPDDAVPDDRAGQRPAIAAQYKLAPTPTATSQREHRHNFTPNVKAHFTYVAIEENLTGGRRALGFGRGDDWAVIASVEVTPIKGLDIRPLYSFVQLNGSTSGSVRSSVGGIGGPPAFTRSAVVATPGLGLYENRHTVGVDARWRWGAFSLDPTAFYQFGIATRTTRSGLRSTRTPARPTSARSSST